MARKTATPSNPAKTTQTKPEATGEVLEVSDPLDLWYLCEKIRYALKYPLIRSDGQPMYQRVVTKSVRRDCQHFDYHFPYIGEVGFDMTHSPPAPIMSKKETHRPSEFPLSAYSAIYQRTLAERVLAENPGVSHAMLTKTDLEAIDAEEAAGKVVTKGRRQRGLFRIPDVLRVKDFSLGGVAQYSQPNLRFVIEIKFDNDRFQPEQQKDYIKIAPEGALRLLTAERCRCQKPRRRPKAHEVRAAAVAREPNYLPAGAKVERALQRQHTLAYVPEYQLLLDDLARELEEVRRRLLPAPASAAGHEVRAAPGLEEEARQRRQAEHDRAGIELILGGPLVVGGTAGAGFVAVEMLGSVAAIGVAASLRSGAKIIPFPQVLRPLATGAAAAVASQRLAAEPAGSPPPTPAALPPYLKPGEPFHFIYFPD